MTSHSSETEASLCREYQDWVDAQGLPQLSADELIFEELSEPQRKYVSAFIHRWEAMLKGGAQ